MAVIRKCEKCGHIDERATWASVADASKDPGFDSWTCPTCAWSEFDLVEAEAEAARA